MPGLSIHVVDVSRGVVAAGMAVKIHRVDQDGSRALIAAGILSSTGTLADPVLVQRLEPGVYEASFAVADYYRAAGVALPTVPFLGVVDYRFGIDDSRAHYHLPFKCTPWGYSCFRGGA
jgi:5-hydroxyisourate hydrolase